MLDLERQLSAQQSVLGALLISPDICGALFERVREEDFVTPELRTVYRAARDLFFAGETVDPVAICYKAGGDEYRKLLMDLMDLTPTAANWESYADILVEQAKLYRWRKVLEQQSTATTLEEARALTGKAAEEVMEHRDGKIVGATQGLVDLMSDQDTEVKPIPFGIQRLDRTILAQRGDFVVIGGRPSAGKTALALQAAAAMCRDYRVGFFSLETSSGKIYTRLVAQMLGVDFQALRRHALDTDARKTIARAAKDFSALNFDCIRAAGMTVEDIQSLTLARRYDVIFVDYLQLVRSSGVNRTEEVSRVSRALHTLATRHDVLVVALAQLSRPESAAEKQKAPTMASFRESGQIEQDADAALLLYLTNPSDPASDRRCKIAKCKEDSPGAFDLAFDGAHQRFTERIKQDNPYARKGRPTPMTPNLSRTPEQIWLEAEGYTDVTDVVIQPEEFT